MSSVNSVINQTGSTTFHQVNVKVKQVEHTVSIIENGKLQYSSCSCGNGDYCDHILRTLAGHAKHLNVNSRQTQKLILESLSKTEDGRKALNRARQLFPAQKPTWLQKQVMKGKKNLYNRLKKWLLSDELD